MTESHSSNSGIETGSSGGSITGVPELLRSPSDATQK